MTSFEENELYPSPADQSILTRMIDEVERTLLEANVPHEEYSQIRIFLADLFVSRGNRTDYLRARDLYKEITEKATLPELRAKAMVGIAELSINSPHRAEWEEGITSCRNAHQVLRASPEDFFTTKSQIVCAELLMKKGDPDDHTEALEIFNKVIESTYSSRYFKIRAVVGKSEIILFFFHDTPEEQLKELEKCLQLATEALRLAHARPNDYFAVKLKVILAEILLALPNRELPHIRELLSKVADAAENPPDLRARSYLRLAAATESPTSMRYIEKIQNMGNIDSFWKLQADELLQHIGQS
jgi:hypothetical protein